MSQHDSSSKHDASSRSPRRIALAGAAVVVMAGALLFVLVIGPRCRSVERNQAPAEAWEAPHALVQRVELGLSFPPLKLDRRPELGGRTTLDFTLEHLDALGLDRVRFAEDWGWQRGDRGEPYDWTQLDRRMARLREAGVRVFLTVQMNAPAWIDGDRNERSCVIPAADMPAFQAYIEELVDRHGDDLHAIQLGNEVLSPHFYAGTVDDYIRTHAAFVEAVRRVDEDLPITLQGFSTGALRRYAMVRGDTPLKAFHRGEWVEYETFRELDWVQREADRLDRLLGECAYDWVDLHFYDDCAQWPTMVEVFREACPDAPIVVTEFGGPHLGYEAFTLEYQATRLEQYLATLARIPGVREAYYFKLVRSEASQPNHRESALIHIEDGTPHVRPAYEVLKAFAATQPARDDGDHEEDGENDHGEHEGEREH